MLHLSCMHVEWGTGLQVLQVSAKVCVLPTPPRCVLSLLGGSSPRWCCVCAVSCSGVITRYLCWIAAAQALPAASVCDLLEAALQVGDSQAVSYICEELPGVQHLQAAEMTKLLLVSDRH